MLEPISRPMIFIAQYFLIVLGILLLPIAILATKAGIPVPLGRIVRKLKHIG